MSSSNDVVPLNESPSTVPQVTELDAVSPTAKATTETEQKEPPSTTALDRQMALLLMRSQSNLGLDMLASTPSGKAILAANKAKSKSSLNVLLGNKADPLMEQSDAKNGASVVIEKPSASKTNSSGAAPRRAFMLGTHATSVMEQREKLVHLQRQSSVFQLIFGWAGIILMVIQLEYAWYVNTSTMPTPCNVDDAGCVHCFDAKQLAQLPTKDQGFMFLMVLRSIISLSTLLLLFNVYRFYVAQTEVLKLKNVVPPTSTLFGSPLQNKFLLEAFVLLLHPFPGLDLIDVKFPSLLLTLSLSMLVRFLLLVRVFKYHGAFNSTNGWFISSLTNIENSTWFFFKTCLKNLPFKTVLLTSAFTIGVGGYLFFCFERFACAFSESSCCEPIEVGDAFWCILITMLTIGYGDVIPHTSPGRVVAILAGLCGIVFAATSIAVLSNLLLLSRSEGKVNAFLRREQHKRLIRNHAARAIQASMQLRAAQSRLKQHPHDYLRQHALAKAERKLYETLHKYRHCKQVVRNEELSDPMDRQMTMLEMMEVNVDHVRARIEELSRTFQARSRSRRRLRHAASIRNSASISEDMAGSRASLTLMDPTNPVTTSDQNGATTVDSANAGSTLPGSMTAQTHIHMKTISSSISAASLASVRSVQSIRGDEAGSPTMLNSDGIPEWAAALENALVTILNQVGRVSVDMEQLTGRVHLQLENIGSRIDEIERRMRVNTVARADGVVIQGRKSFGAPASSGSTMSHDELNAMTDSPSTTDLKPALRAAGSLRGSALTTEIPRTNSSGFSLAPLRRSGSGVAPMLSSAPFSTNSN